MAPASLRSYPHGYKLWVVTKKKILDISGLNEFSPQVSWTLP